MAAASDPHVPVLLGPLLRAVAPVAGVWVDGTFGAGGYARGLLAQGAQRVIGIDRDPSVFRMARDWAGEYGDRLRLTEGTFSDLDRLAGEPVDGVVLDLGVSSMQLDQAERGFSFLRDGPLDMRMGGDGPTAADLLNSAPEAVIADVLYLYGEERASRRIGDIISVIDGIAFQTNILALNAAVEAARAGEQGRGFAVVAGEVRTLAQRSAEAAREIKALIHTSVDKVASGARLVQDAGQTMDEIVGSVQRVGDIIGDIAASASEQSTRISQVNQDVMALDQMTQQNAALVEESNAAAAHLHAQASQLQELISYFRLGTASPAKASAPRREERSPSNVRELRRNSERKVSAAPADEGQFVNFN